MWLEVEGADYVVWRRLLELSGDIAMGARLDAVHAARQSGCKTALALSDGGVARLPLMVLAEAAVAAQQGKTEQQWREEWTRTLIKVAGRWQDAPTVRRLVAVLNSAEAIILDMKAARVWPWLNQKQRRGALRAD
jgi:hypothetical protein